MKGDIEGISNNSFVTKFGSNWKKSTILGRRPRIGGGGASPLSVVGRLPQPRLPRIAAAWWRRYVVKPGLRDGDRRRSSMKYGTAVGACSL